MKNRLFIKAGTIVILLFGIILFMNSSTHNNTLNSVSAANSGSKVQLQINEGSVTCTGWYGILNMGAANAQFSAQTMSGTYSGNSRGCIDTRGTGTWAFTIKLTGDLYGGYGNAKISSGAAFICLTGAINKVQGGTVTTPPTTSISICASAVAITGAQDILRRSDVNGEIYEYKLTPRIGVNVPMNQAPGVYTGVLDISLP